MSGREFAGLAARVTRLLIRNDWPPLDYPYWLAIKAALDRNAATAELAEQALVRMVEHPPQFVDQVAPRWVELVEQIRREQRPAPAPPAGSSQPDDLDRRWAQLPEYERRVFRDFAADEYPEEHEGRNSLAAKLRRSDPRRGGELWQAYLEGIAQSIWRSYQDEGRVKLGRPRLPLRTRHHGPGRRFVDRATFDQIVAHREAEKAAQTSVLGPERAGTANPPSERHNRSGGLTGDCRTTPEFSQP